MSKNGYEDQTHIHKVPDEPDNGDYYTRQEQDRYRSQNPQRVPPMNYPIPEGKPNG